jgi:hypothetical protein
VPFPSPGYVGVYHERDPETWSGPTGYYYQDYRALPELERSVTYEPLAMWADESYSEKYMSLAMQADTDYAPPRNRQYYLELLHVPDGITEAPPIGTLWEVPAQGPFVIRVPTYRSKLGEDAYQFRFTMTAAPEPASLLILATLSIFAVRRG